MKKTEIIITRFATTPAGLSEERLRTETTTNDVSSGIAEYIWVDRKDNNNNDATLQIPIRACRYRKMGSLTGQPFCISNNI
jgi:hypothetical protein